MTNPVGARREGWEEGYEEGLKLGRLKVKRDAALVMLKGGCSIDLIEKIMKLARNEIEDFFFT